ncbi:MAG TPA: GTP-binding protein [Candidatus Brocadiia bacterium]|nr:GTP-binding protein [Candidatus Brocadiia bacterium]
MICSAKPDAARERGQALRLVITGHVDHGKSTLIGRLLYDTGSLAPEKMEEIRRVSRDLGRDVEFAYLMDYLEEERVNEMTLDTAHAFFHSARREYVIIDAPGHRELLRNMITGAAQAQAAVLLVDAAEGAREQTMRHATFLSLLGLKRPIVFINKMDKVGYSQERFEEVSAEVRRLLTPTGAEPASVIPGSALTGENIAKPSERMAWYRGPCLLDALDTLSPPSARPDAPLRFPVQDVFDVDGRRALLGRVESGRMRAGQEVVFLPSGMRGIVEKIAVFNEEREAAERGECIGVFLSGTGLPKRGDVACPAEAAPALASRFRATVFWMAAEPCRRGETLTARFATQEVPYRVEAIETRLDSSTCQVIEANADRLEETETGQAVLVTQKPLALELHADIPELGWVIFSRGAEVVGGGLVVALES